MLTTRARLAFAVTLLAAIAGQGWATSASDPQQPRLVIAEPMKDFGPVVTGTEMTHAFVLRNDGAAPLEIHEVRPAMGVAVKSFDAAIAPGKTGTVVVFLDGLRVIGAGSTFVDVLSNDSAQPTARLGVSFDVKPAVMATPGYARWLYVQREVEGTITQLVYAADAQPFEVLGVDTPKPYIRATFSPATDAERDPAHPGQQWKVDLRLDASAQVGAIEGLAIVRTNHPKQARVPIPLSGFVRPRYFVEPASGTLGKVTLDAAKNVMFSLRNFGTAPVEITAVETTIPGVTATATPVVAGHRYSIVVRLDPAVMATGSFQGKVVVHLSDRLEPTIEMPLSGELVRSGKVAG